MVEKLLNTLADLKEVRNCVADLEASGHETLIRDVKVGYESVIDDILELAGLSERETDLLWEITEN